VLNISLDITERVKAENILVQRTHELQQSNESLEEFAFVASHDLKEPLRKISVFTDRLARSTHTFTNTETSYLNKVVNASLRMQQMIDDLLSLSLISTNLAEERVDLECLLQEVIQTFEHRIEELQASVRSDGLPSALIVPSQIRQLFQNLISNCLKFVRVGEKPIIKIGHRFISSDSVSQQNLRPATRYLELTFADNGIGFEREFEEKIFAVFHRLHHKHEYEGTGIGLAICRKIVKSNGGAIVATGSKDQGATFTITLPQ
jgi:light-regulated signal transduction histidine kinase (bacteriophytochrome)